MVWEVERLADEILGLLVDGPATVSQLETATGHPAGDIHRALATLFATMTVEPMGEAWQRKRVTLVAR